MDKKQEMKLDHRLEMMEATLEELVSKMDKALETVVAPRGNMPYSHKTALPPTED